VTTTEDAAIRVLELRHSELRRHPPKAPTPWHAAFTFVMPWIDRARATGAARLLAQRAGASMLLLAVQDDTGSGPVAIWNDALVRSAGTWFGYVADDAFPGRQWLRFARDALARAPAANLLAFNDGKWFGQLAGFGLVRRTWVEGLYGGSLFHPGYRQHYGDTELTLIARQQQTMMYEPHAMLVEIDEQKDRRSVNERDRELFLQRQASGFDERVQDPSLLRLFG
jgi:hypothetical protein